MGQKSNFITLRQENQNKISFYNDNFIIYKYIFCYYLEVFLKQRGVYILYNDFFFKNAVGFVNFNLFYIISRWKKKFWFHLCLRSLSNP